MKKNVLIPNLSLCVVFILFSNTVFSQDCVCNNYLNSIYDYTRIQKSANFLESFKKWFFSEQFEQDESKSSTSLDITIPIDGVPVDFGYGHESADAWKKWSLNIGSTHWDFSQITEENIFLKSATPQARQVWLECVESQCNTKFPVIYKLLPSGGLSLTIGYNANLLDKAPTYTNFACQGLGCEVQTAKYKGKRLKKGEGETIIFSWGKNKLESGTITVNTSAGSSITIPVSRSIPVNLATLSYTTISYGDSSDLDQSELETHIGGAFTVNGIKETKWYSGCQAVSPDGKYCAVVTPFIQAKVPHKYFRNLLLTKGINSDWTDKLNGNAPLNDVINGPYLQYWIKNWGPNATWNFSFDVYKSKQTYLRKSISSALNNGSFSFSLPKDGQNYFITLNLTDQTTISFDPLVDALPARIRRDPDTADNLNTFNYTVLP